MSHFPSPGGYPSVFVVNDKIQAFKENPQLWRMCLGPGCPRAAVNGALLSGPAGCAVRHTSVWDVYHLAF